MSTLKQRQHVQAELGVARDLIDKVELALICEYDTMRSREVLLYSRKALMLATQCIGGAHVAIGDALNILEAEEEYAATVDGAAARGTVVPRAKDGNDQVSRRPARTA